MTNKCGFICCAIVVGFPIIFYSPKFLEYRYQKMNQTSEIAINCSQHFNMNSVVRYYIYLILFHTLCNYVKSTLHKKKKSDFFLGFELYEKRT